MFKTASDLIFLINLISTAHPDFKFACVNNGNFTTNSTYDTNLSRLFSQLWVLQFARRLGPGHVNAIGLWRGDQMEDICRSCLNETVVELQQRCPSYKKAIGWSECCTLRYSNQSMKGSPFAIISHVNNTSHVDGFNQALSSLLTNLSSRAAAGGSLRNDSLTTATSRISSDCYGCMQSSATQLTTLMPLPDLKIFRNRLLFIVLRPKLCVLREMEMEMEQNNSNNHHCRRCFRCRHSVTCPLHLDLFKMQKLSQGKMRNVTADGLSTAESLQYDLATVRAATKNFCEENKLGQGGFGAVYKGKLPHGQDIAVKRLSRASRQGDLEFKNEVLFVAKLQHRNLVRLLGFCLKGD
ncbi:hypothetical protein SLEP1_g57168 [Rubroshorea leprosula]|uniref:Uncharacterized protein n=1 Tax=Rubroshorea leprosula TaxID=152421 RepID=A0AAV5MKE9_9ROSI|nr:hypothetical protein SLEP1_g57168 [Rubroshorea leprosula]